MLRLAAVFAIAAIAGCVAPPARESDRPDEAAQAAASRAIAANAHSLRMLATFEASGVCRIEVPREDSGFDEEQLDLLLILERPRRTALRLKLSVSDTLAWLGSDGEQWWLFLPEEVPSIAYRGRIDGEAIEAGDAVEQAPVPRPLRDPRLFWLLAGLEPPRDASRASIWDADRSAWVIEEALDPGDAANDVAAGLRVRRGFDARGHRGVALVGRREFDGLLLDLDRALKPANPKVRTCQGVENRRVLVLAQVGGHFGGPQGKANVAVLGLDVRVDDAPCDLVERAGILVVDGGLHQLAAEHARFGVFASGHEDRVLDAVQAVRDFGPAFTELVKHAEQLGSGLGVHRTRARRNLVAHGAHRLHVFRPFDRIPRAIGNAGHRDVHVGRVPDVGNPARLVDEEGRRDAALTGCRHVIGVGLARVIKGDGVSHRVALVGGHLADLLD